MKRTYSWKVKTGAAKTMANILNYPDQVDNRMDDGTCYVTETTYTINANIKRSFQEEFQNDRLLQIKVLDVNDKEFLVLQSLLESAENVIVRNE